MTKTNESRFGLVLPTELYDWLRRTSYLECISQAEIVRRALERYRNDARTMARVEKGGKP